MPVVDNGEVEGAGDIGIGVRQTNPLAEWSKAFGDGVRSRVLGWTEEVSHAVARGILRKGTWVILEPVSLVGSVVEFVLEVASEEFGENSTVRVGGGVLPERCDHVNADKCPFGCRTAGNAMGNEEKFILARNGTCH